MLEVIFQQLVSRLPKVVEPCWSLLLGWRRNSWPLMVVDKMVVAGARPPSRWSDLAMTPVLLFAMLAAVRAAPQYGALSGALSGAPSTQRCSTVQEEQCTTVDSVQCSTEQDCSKVEENVCSTASVQECRVVDRQECATVQEEVRPTPLTHGSRNTSPKN